MAARDELNSSPEVPYFWIRVLQALGDAVFIIIWQTRTVTWRIFEDDSKYQELFTSCCDAEDLGWFFGAYLNIAATKILPMQVWQFD